MQACYVDHWELYIRYAWNILLILLSETAFVQYCMMVWPIEPAEESYLMCVSFIVGCFPETVSVW